MTKMIPLRDLDRRAPEAGRIRLGVKSGKAMKSIETFRFTSPHQASIEHLARIYGGTARPWSDPKANKGQWEVITEANRIEIIVQPEGLSLWYELWSGGGCARRCDGETVQTPSRDPNEMYDQSPCICNAKGVSECRPYTRLNVVLPAIDFAGMWRLETKGWNAAHELPGMFDMLTALRESGAPVRGFMHLEQRTSTRAGKTKHFVVPTLSMGASPNELIEGKGRATLQLEGEKMEGVRELGQAPVYLDPERDSDGLGMPDAEIVEAVVVMTSEVEAEIEGQIRTIAEANSLDPDAVVATIWTMTDGDEDKLRRFIEKSTEGKLLEWTQTGRLKWTSL